MLWHFTNLMAALKEHKTLLERFLGASGVKPTSRVQRRIIHFLSEHSLGICRIDVEIRRGDVLENSDGQSFKARCKFDVAQLYLLSTTLRK